MALQIIVSLIFGALIFHQLKNLFNQRYYLDMVVVGIFYAIAFYYTYGYFADLNVVNPVDGLLWILEPVGKKIFVDILG